MPVHRGLFQKLGCKNSDSLPRMGGIYACAPRVGLLEVFLHRAFQLFRKLGCKNCESLPWVGGTYACAPRKLDLEISFHLFLKLVRSWSRILAQEAGDCQ
eukprot:1157935-Pelagomonas_calceolata.AAC.21